jgi:hypothetical protein
MLPIVQLAFDADEGIYFLEVSLIKIQRLLDQFSGHVIIFDQLFDRFIPFMVRDGNVPKACTLRPVPRMTGVGVPASPRR